jgi:hypothetical protein
LERTVWLTLVPVRVDQSGALTMTQCNGRTDVADLELDGVRLGEVIVRGVVRFGGDDLEGAEDTVGGTGRRRLEARSPDGDLVQEGALDAALMEEDCAGLD